ncbi:MAG: lysostaphin resistance A-like protein [Promethearchaeota archaeon]
MNNKEINDFNKNHDYSGSENLKEIENNKWLYCPICGNEIPKIDNLKYCIVCGNNLEYLKKNKRIKPIISKNPYIKTQLQPKVDNLVISFEQKKIVDDEINNTKNHGLWGTWASIGVPFGAFFLLNFITAGFLVLIALLSFNLDSLFDMISNPYFLILSFFFELVFILVPVLYARKFLQNPTLKNSLTLLGFTSKGLKSDSFLKEILIGLGFALIGIFLMYSVSFLSEIVIELFFGIEIISEINSIPSDIDLIIFSTDLFGLIFLSITMILIIGTSEEILFRGFMQKGLMRSLGTKGGIIITALIFTLIHVLGVVLLAIDDPLLMIVSFLLSFFPYFILSLMLGLLYYWRNENLVAVIVTHGVYNALVIILAYILNYFF